MFLINGVPGRFVPSLGTHGITPAQISLGDADSPLLNDIDAGDDSTELIWVLTTPLVSSGTTTATDHGGYTLAGAADGTHVQGYRLLALLADGTDYSGTASITTVVGAGGVTIPTGLCTEADTALALTLRKARAAGLAAETDTAAAIALRKRAAVGLASETDSALARQLRKVRGVGVATDAETALALTISNLGPGLNVGAAQESDTALPLPLVKRLPSAISAETDAALQRTIQRVVRAAAAAETDSAIAAAMRKVRAVGAALESDIALALAWRSFRVEVAVETDLALALSFVSAVVDLSAFHRYDVPGELLGYAVPGNTYTIEA